MTIGLASGQVAARARTSNNRAVAQARDAALACSRAAVERAEVALPLDGGDRPPHAAAR